MSLNTISQVWETSKNRLLDSSGYSPPSSSQQEAQQMVAKPPSARLLKIFGGFLVGCALVWFATRGRATYSFERNVVETREKHLVIASYSKQNVSWLDEIPSDWTIKKYVMDQEHPVDGLAVPRNFGREAMAYLTYIIDHYDDLPAYSVFVHGHYRAWHQQAPIPAKIRALNLTALEEENYISFRCENNQGCERTPYLDTYHVTMHETHIRHFWNYVLPNDEMPRNISYKCCGQHAASRKAIQTRSKEDWIRIRSPLMQTWEEMANEEFATNPPINEYIIGAFYEKMWHLFLGTGPHFCPSIDHCRKVHFSNAVICSGDQDLTTFNGELYKTNRCVTAFDGLPPDEEPDWDSWWRNFNILSQGLSIEKLNQWKAKDERIEELEAKVKKLKGGGL